MNNEQKAQSFPSASLVQNGVLAEAKFRPILFSTDMVTAILEGRKTQTRRIIKEIPAETKLIWFDNAEWIVENDEGRCWKGQLKQRYKVGDILWVRETWRNNDTQTGCPYHYYEDDSVYTNKDNEKWKPSIFMPKTACRIFLKITDVKVERLQGISEEDAVKEGIEIMDNCGRQWFKNYLNKDVSFINSKHVQHNYSDKIFSSSQMSFVTLWQKINGSESWEANPFVWVIEFEVTERPPGFC